MLFIRTSILFGCICIIASCSKNNESTRPSDGSWYVYRTGGIEYKLDVSTTTRREIDGFKVLTATSTEPGPTSKTISMWFTKWPASSASYRPVEFLYNRELKENEVGISLTFPGKDTLYSTGLKFVGISPDPAEDIQVTVDKGKLSVSIPMMSSRSITYNGTDSASFNAVLLE